MGNIGPINEGNYSASISSIKSISSESTDDLDI